MPVSTKPDAIYDVRSVNTGATVISGVAEDVARDECARLNAEARVVVGSKGGRTIYRGMERGEVTRYEVVSKGGLVL